jgi:hypothetical protein
MSKRKQNKENAKEVNNQPNESKKRKAYKKGNNKLNLFFLIKKLIFVTKKTILTKKINSYSITF